MAIKNQIKNFIIIGFIFIFFIIPMLKKTLGTQSEYHQQQQKTSETSEIEVVIDCSWNIQNPWNDWSDCSANTGTKTRTINRIIARLNGGRTCPGPETISCDVDCSWNIQNPWNDWSDCSANTGTRTRTINRTIAPLNGGTDCPGPQTIICQIVLSSGEKYIVFNYTSDSPGLTGQTEYIFTVSNSNLEAIILIVGGGGGGGYSGGGGGGGDVSLNNITIPIGSHKIRVGMLLVT